ncbi:MAG: cysteine--tRNA ligase [Candidatus Moranbacteria bacterium]|nr:cysteine--tRNA ligase [Candidatus Moranbacteria bacterium]
MLKLYNTLTKQKEEFKPIHKGKVSIYTCGPTVYDYIHIGNLRSFTTADVLRRYLEYSGYEVRHIKNITDVGHLTADDIAQADTGEDKILKKALAEKKTPEEIAKFYTEAFHRDEDAVNILRAHFFPKATAHIPQMIKIIKTLIEKGNAYEKNGNVFFDVTSFKDYGKLSGNTLEQLKVGARLEEHPDKKHPWDFALWLKADPKHILQWDSPWSRGYPGWHIECSAMATEYLGDTLDIHTGGEDNIFPHHEAEIAQSECATDKKFVNFWVHTRHLLVEGEKMSKSKGNFYILKDIKEKGFDPMHLRLLYLSSHYRKNLDFSWKAMDQAKANYERIAEWIGKLKNIVGDAYTRPESTARVAYMQPLQIFESAMDDDLNTPLALSILYTLITDTNKKLSKNKLDSNGASEAFATFEKMNKVFGLKFPEKETEILEEVKKLADERLESRKSKDFQKSDKLRKEIEKLGYVVEDMDNSYKLKRSL